MNLKRIISLITLVTLLMSIPVFAEITADATFTAFTSSSDTTLNGWTTYSSATSDKKWVIDTTNYLAQCNILTTSTGAAGNAFYTAKDFGSEYTFSGKVGMSYNQIGIYFNASVEIVNGQVLPTGGYRLYANRASTGPLRLEKYVDGEWIVLDSITSGLSGFSGDLPFEIINDNGVISASLTLSSSGKHTLTYDDSADDDYLDSGYVGFWANSTLMKFKGINVSYNSQKVYSAPTLHSCSDILKEKSYNILKTDETKDVFVKVDTLKETNVSKCELFMDELLVCEMTKDTDDVFKYNASFKVGEKGPHTIKVVLTDKNGTQNTLCKGAFFANDFYASDAKFILSDESVVTKVGESDLSNVTASIDFNPYDKNISSVTIIAVKYNDNKSVDKIYKNPVNITANSVNTITCPIDTIEAGKKVTVFLCESLLKPAPLSGGFTLE